MGWATEGPQKKEPKKIKKKNTKTGEENKARSRPQTIAEEKLHQIPERERRLHNSTQEHRKNDLILFSRRAMPTFTAMALDRLIEPGASKPADKSAPTSMPVPNSQKLERGTSAPTKKSKVHQPPLKAALCITPEVTPLPDAPSSFPPSPYIINHKCRGPHLLKSSSEANALSEVNICCDENDNDKSLDAVDTSTAGDLQVTSTKPELVKEEKVNGVYEGQFDWSNDVDLQMDTEKLEVVA
ncbi:hypothetical protein D0Y65_029223 [Glycine soja]|uniref:Uncharacterized protein n=1 Tax=Glycine soja TaxID=3848 RepID=A0A445HYA2_GLYSO|nr:hypothetical protein D0Y65_029223 [Glycine soja]RZB78739.1 hypothetical protein D0Y65_029223 [Glycine soja]